MNIQNMMKQAQEMQTRLQQQMTALRVEGTAGGGMVTVTMSGDKKVHAVRIDPEVVSKDDVEMLQDMVMAAVNEALRSAQALADQRMGSVMGPMGGMGGLGGLGLPGF